MADGIIVAYKPTRQERSAGLPIRHILSSLGMHCARFDPWSLWLARHRCSGTMICIILFAYSLQQTQRRVPLFGEMRCCVLHFATVASMIHLEQGQGKAS
jgi:hypothetical protein